MEPDAPRRIADLDTLKAFGHPLRMRLYRALFIARTATASQLAAQLGEAVSLISYHLRKLAGHGLIEEAGQQSADSRERWWQVASQGVQLVEEDFHDAPEDAAAHRAVNRVSLDQRGELYRRFLDEQQTWVDEWRSASFSSEYLPRLTVAELWRLNGELHELLRRWDAHSRAAEAAGDTEGRENVALHVYGFPFHP